MRIGNDTYSDDFLLKKLKESSREVRYEYILTSASGQRLGNIDVSNASVSFNSKTDVMRTFRGTVRKSDLVSLSSIDFRIMPYMVLKVGAEDVRFPLGCFIISPAYSASDYTDSISVVGYDETKIAYDDKITSRFFTAEGGVYTSYVGQILGEIYNDVDIVPSESVRSYDQEWESGSSRLEIANTLLDAIGYTKIYADEVGIIKSDKYIFPQLRQIERSYETRHDSVILDGIDIESDAFDVPNTFVRYTQNVDAEYMIATYVNDDPNNKYSTVSRGRTIVDSKSVNDIASQEDLNNLVQKTAIESMQATEVLTFSTLNMPGHGFRNCLQVFIEPYSIFGKFIETSWNMDLSEGGTMRHVCERVVEL